MSEGPQRHILVVCTANRCRSAMAEGLIRSRLEHEGRLGEIDVASAGTWVDEDLPATEFAIAAMAERGIDIHDHRAQEVTAESIAAADLILTMTVNHQTALEAEFAPARGKTRLFSALAGGTWDIADPVGGSLDDYRATAAELERLLDDGWAVVLGEEPDSPA